MAFFRPIYGNADPSFTPLFRLLDDFDTYSRGNGGSSQHRHHRTHLPSFTPKFDVRETETAYELHGELAGMDKKDVHVEFTDPQTMLIRGRVMRTYTAGTPPAGAIEGGDLAAGAITDSGEDHHSNGHKATVQDETEAEKEETVGQEVTPPKKDDAPADGAKYWVSERSVGEFSRTFNFPGRVDQEAVTAGLKDGILTVVVPKAKKHESRRIAIE